MAYPPGTELRASTRFGDGGSARARPFPRSVFLAGGLGPDNAAEAIADVQAFGVDACPRLCRNGCLDEGLLTEFFNAIRDALAF